MLLKQEIIITILCLFVPAGYMYCQLWPQTLETPLREPPYNFTSMQYNMIFLATMLPISIASIPLGMIVDKIPLKTSCWIILGAQFLSQLITAILFFFSFSGFYYVILIMRMIFGLTSETTITLNSVIVQKYVRKNNLDFVMSLVWTIPMFFDAANSYISTAVYNSTHKIYLPLFIGSGVAFLSFICCHISLMQNKKPNQNDQVQQKQQQHKFNLKDIKSLEKRFWIYVLMVFIANCSMTPYFDNLTDMIIKRFGISYSTAGILVMIPSFLVPFFSFFWIWIVKKYQSKRRTMFILMGSCTVSLHAIVMATPNTQYPGTGTFILIVLAFTLFAIGYAGFLGLISPNTTIMVPKHLIGTAYGCVGSTFALSMTIMPIFNGLITSITSDLSKNYFYLQFIYLPISLVYLFLLIYVEKSKSQIFRKLDHPRQQQESLLKQSQISSQ